MYEGLLECFKSNNLKPQSLSRCLLGKRKELVDFFIGIYILNRCGGPKLGSLVFPLAFLMLNAFI